tara:strand:+ start:394 stop:945 length:552 start_codon:yes stop_codon:yes gene_type:complete
MAGQRLTDKTAMTTTPGTGDLLMVVDVNDTTGSAAGTSKKIDNKFFLQTDKISITNAEFLAMYSDGRTVVSSPGAGFAIIPINVYCEYTEGSSANTNTVELTFGHTNKSTQYYWDTNRYWMDSPSYNGSTQSYSGGAPSTRGLTQTGTIEDKGLYAYFKGSAPTGGATGTLVLYVTYRIIDIT